MGVEQSTEDPEVIKYSSSYDSNHHAFLRKQSSTNLKILNHQLVSQKEIWENLKKLNV